MEEKYPLKSILIKPFANLKDIAVEYLNTINDYIYPKEIEKKIDENKKLASKTINIEYEKTKIFNYYADHNFLFNYFSGTLKENSLEDLVLLHLKKMFDDYKKYEEFIFSVLDYMKEKDINFNILILKFFFFYNVEYNLVIYDSAYDSEKVIELYEFLKKEFENKILLLGLNIEKILYNRKNNICPIVIAYSDK